MPEFVSPYADTGTWLRGNLHTHTTASDGSCDVDEVISDYEGLGYGFLAISDHDVLVNPSEFRGRSSMILLPAVEISANGPNLLHIGATEVLRPVENRQAVLDEIDNQDGMSIIAHPQWKEDYAHWTHDALVCLDGFTGIEIYNGAIERRPGAAVATNQWDRLLSAGKKIWGYANDDSHQSRDVAVGWNVVYVDERSPSAVFKALTTGRFYASTGVGIRGIQTCAEEITIETDNAQRIRFVSDYGVVQQTIYGSDATFQMPDQLVGSSSHTYVRVECDGVAGAKAWTQPMFIE